MQRPHENNPPEPHAMGSPFDAPRATDHDLLGLLLDQVADCILVCDAQGQVRAASQAVRRLLAINPLGQPFDGVLPLELVGKSSGEGTAAPFTLAAIQRGERLRAVEVKLHRPNREVTYFLLAATPLTSATGQPAGCLITLTDVTRPKRVQEEKNRLLEELAHVNTERERLINRLGEALRATLDPIQGTLEAYEIRQERALGAPEINTIRDQAQRLRDILDEIETYSGLSQNQIKLQQVPVELGAVLRGVLAECHRQGQEGRREIITQLPSEPVWLLADPARLRQMLGHLMHNAIRYNQPEGQVWLVAKQVADDAVITVRDSGQGIAPGELARIFEPFNQAGAPAGALGLGLTLVRGLAALHGGTIDVQSEGIGMGSEFTLRLPLVNTNQPGESATVAEETTTGGRRALRILIVEDNADIANSMAELLEQLGYSVQVAYDGLEAMQKAMAYEPEVVLLDIGLPHMDGYHVARLLRQKAELSSSLIVAITGYSLPRDIERSYYAGIDLHLTKPVNLNFLKELLAAQSGQTLTL